MTTSPPSPNWPWMSCIPPPQSVTSQATSTTRGDILSTQSRLGRRLLQLYAGLVLYGVSSGLLVEAGLGLEPWGVLHQGLAELSGLTIGVVSIVVGAAVLLLWIPL